jgi:hypothetical protein
MKAQKGVWFATHADIARHVAESAQLKSVSRAKSA